MIYGRLERNFWSTPDFISAGFNWHNYIWLYEMIVNKKPNVQNIKEDIEYTEKILEVTINERDRFILHRLISEQKEFLDKLESSKAEL